MDAEAHPWLEGGAAILAARHILSTPGGAGVDFETFPTAPAWHGMQAARSSPRGRQAEAREKAVREARLAGRAHRRRACTLQLAHEAGMEVFIRLADPERELPAMFDLPPWEDRATLIAHNSQFETEVLARYGVAADIECTLVAAKCLYLVAVQDDQPQPVSFGLADLVAREFGRSRDKSVRNRDWRQPLDAQAVEYGLQDVRDTLALWQRYSSMLEQRGLMPGYRVIQGSILPTAEINVRGGLVLDGEAHARLMRTLREAADDAWRELSRICAGGIANHGSDAQVSDWILSEVLGYPVRAPAVPKAVSLVEFLRSRGGLRPDPGGELRSRDLGNLVTLTGMSLEDATIAAQEHGYIGDEFSRSQLDTDAGRSEENELLAALDRGRFGVHVLKFEDQARADAYEETKADFDDRHIVDPHRLTQFNMRLNVRTNGAIKAWRPTKTGHLGLRRGTSLRKAETLRDAYPRIADYLVKRAHWRKAQKLLDAFGPTLRQWRDADGTIRGQHKTYGAWTGRQSCVDPNLQNQPHDDEFRALWVALPGRKLVIADYSQIELRLLAIVAGDELLREVYREGRDVHAETAAIAGIDRKSAKSCNFAMAYGSGAAGLSENFGFDLDESRRIIAAVLGAYTGLAKFREIAPAMARANGHISIRPNREVGYDANSPGTCAINAPVQGSAASVQMRALRLIYDALTAQPHLDIKLAASIHDEIILDSCLKDAEEAAKILVEGMTGALIEIFPEAEEQGLARLTAAGIIDRWSDKP